MTRALTPRTSSQGPLALVRRARVSTGAMLVCTTRLPDRHQPTLAPVGEPSSIASLDRAEGVSDT